MLNIYKAIKRRKLQNIELKLATVVLDVLRIASLIFLILLLSWFYLAYSIVYRLTNKTALAEQESGESVQLFYNLHKIVRL